MIYTLRTFILLYAYGWFKKNSERSVYMNSRMLSLMLHTAIKVTIIAGIVHVSITLLQCFSPSLPSNKVFIIKVMIESTLFY